MKRQKNNTGTEDIVYIGSSDECDLLYVDLAGITLPDPSYYTFHDPSYNIYVFEYVLSGCGKLEYNGQIYDINGPCSYYLRRDTSCVYYSDTKTPLNKIWVNATGILLDKLTETYGIDRPFMIADISFESQIRNIHALLCNKDHSASIALYFHEMIALLNKQSSIAPKKTLADRIRIYLDAHATEDISLVELSSVFDISRTKLIYTFNSAYAESPYSYFVKKKISIACNLLIRTVMPIKEISKRLTFSDAAYFSNVFKRIIGISPKEYRNKHKSL